MGISYSPFVAVTVKAVSVSCDLYFQSTCFQAVTDFEEFLEAHLDILTHAKEQNVNLS